MYGALFSLSELARGIQNTLLLKPVRQGVNQDASTFCSYINTTGEIVVNSQSFEMLKALMWLAGFHEQNGPRGITIWTPIMKGTGRDHDQQAPRRHRGAQDRRQRARQDRDVHALGRLGPRGLNHEPDARDRC